MAKEKFEIFIEYNYKTIAVASSLREYRVSFLLNKTLNINLEKEENIVIDNKNKSKISFFDLQKYSNKENGNEYFLVSNKNLDKHFLSSLKKFDFVFIIKSEIEIVDFEDSFLKLKEIEKFQIVHKVDSLSKREYKIIEDNIIYKKKEPKKPNENSHK